MYSMQLITIQIVSKNRIIHARTDNLYESEQRKQQQQKKHNFQMHRSADAFAQQKIQKKNIKKRNW